MGNINMDRMTKTDLNNILKDVGESVWFYRATRTTSNIGADEDVSFADKKKQIVVMQFSDENFNFTREGLVRTPEVSMFCRSSLNPARRDVVVPTRNNRSYGVQKTSIRNSVAISELMELGR